MTRKRKAVITERVVGAAVAVHIRKAHAALLKSAFPVTAPALAPLALQSDMTSCAHWEIEKEKRKAQNE